MRKITFLLGAGIGFVAGSKAGKGPYQQLEAKVREVTKRPGGSQASQEPVSAFESHVADAAAPAPPPIVNGTAETVTDAGVVLPAGADV